MLRQKQLEMHRKKAATIKVLGVRLKKKHAIKTLKQTIKRKNKQMKKLKEQFSSSNQSQVLQTAKEQASALNKINYMMKLYHKKRQPSSLPVIPCEQDLQENILLEEKIKDMEDMTKKTKSDRRFTTQA